MSIGTQRGAAPPAASSAFTAFSAADFGDARGILDLWTDPAFHIDSLHGDLADRLSAEFFARTRTEEGNPAGAAFTGPSGAGKTHFLGLLRRRVVEGGGFFVQVDAGAQGGFWSGVASGYADALRRRVGGGRTQTGAVLLGLLTRLSADEAARAAVAGRKPGGSSVDLLLDMLAAVEPARTHRWRDVVRALALCDSRKADIAGFAAAWLKGEADNEGARQDLRFVAPPHESQEIVRGLLWVVALASPTLIVIDGLPPNPRLKEIAAGLLGLHEAKRRAMTVFADQEENWAALLAEGPVAAIFRPPRALPPVESPVLVERFISGRLAPAYAYAGFAPPYASFPFTRAALASGVGLTPGELLRRCRDHQRVCRAEGGIRECDSLTAPLPRERAPPPEPLQREIFVGRSVQIGEFVGPVALPVEALPRNIAALGGAGRGALLCRLIEEAALAGVPALVIDTAGEFLRLDEPWPSRPTDFSNDDARKAKAYFERVDLALWTPGLAEGRSLTLGFMPDFAAPEALDEEAQELALEIGVAALEPYLPSRGAKAIRLRGLLADALRAFARDGGGSLPDFIRFVAAAPQSLSRLPDAMESARTIAEGLLAALRADPLLRPTEEPLDPAQFFEGAPGKTRISVIHLGGLEASARSAVAGRLMATLAGWILRHPEPAGRLLVLDEAHLFAPAGETNVAKRGALALARNAGHGIGLIFATQAPRALDPEVLNACDTQLCGGVTNRLDAQAVEEAMVARGAAPDALSALRQGEYFFVSEGFGRPIRLRPPISLSRRTPHPLRGEEIVARARRGMP